MPTYQYRCNDCDNEFEIVQKFSDAALTDCPACDGQLRKVFSAVGVVFKGSGFYATDNRTKGKSTAATAKPSGDTSSTSAASTPASGTSATSTSATSSSSAA